jgi:hypothetical protein
MRARAAQRRVSYGDISGATRRDGSSGGSTGRRSRSSHRSIARARNDGRRATAECGANTYRAVRNRRDNKKEVDATRANDNLRRGSRRRQKVFSPPRRLLEQKNCFLVNARRPFRYGAHGRERLHRSLVRQRRARQILQGVRAAGLAAAHPPAPRVRRRLDRDGVHIQSTAVAAVGDNEAVILRVEEDALVKVLGERLGTSQDCGEQNCAADVLVRIRIALKIRVRTPITVVKTTVIGTTAVGTTVIAYVDSATRATARAAAAAASAGTTARAADSTQRQKRARLKCVAQFSTLPARAVLVAEHSRQIAAGHVTKNKFIAACPACHAATTRSRA